MAIRHHRRESHVRRPTSARLFGALFAAACVAVTTAQGPPANPGDQGGGKLKVMTYNVYVGTEYAGMTSSSLDDFLQAATNLVLDVRASDPAGRALAVARQIAVHSPHLVSLQEVFTLSTGLSRDDLTLEYDYLELILQALADLGMQYAPVASLTTWDATVPSSLGLYVRNTWRVALLARADLKAEHLVLTNVQSATWPVAYTLRVSLRALDGRADLCPVALSSDGRCRMPMPRGWISADVVYRGDWFRFIGAHLDSASPVFEVPQGLELLNGPANTALPVVVAADLNCDCSDSGDPFYETCVNFSDYGFTDAWTVARPWEPGYTVGEIPNLTGRSDYVMVRGPLEVSAAAIVGKEPADMTTTGLYPSDHAGVVVKFGRW
jgi:hypothetical protein